MIHTLELTNMINEKKAIKVLAEYYDLIKIQELLIELKREKVVLDIPLNIPGLILTSIANVRDEYYKIYLRVEPQSLINGRRTIDVFDCSTRSVEKLRGSLDGAIEYLSRTLPKSDAWFVSRIDFTKNLTTEYVKECVALAKKGKDPYCFKDTIDKAGSSYRRSKSVILNYYDKSDHLTKQIENDSFDQHLLKEAHNIYRIEVQCLNYKKLSRIREKFNLPTKSNLYDYLCPDIAEWALFSYYDKVIGRGDYYSLAEALKIIEVSNWSPRIRKNITNWLKLIAQAKSMSKARMQFVNGTAVGHKKIVVQGSINTFRNYEKACKEIGINPVTIPKDWGIDYIPNPVNSLDTSKIIEIK